MSAKADRRARKRERAARGATEAFWAERPAYIRSRIVCDGCGLDQPFRASSSTDDETGLVTIAPCEGPLGLACPSETAVWLDSFPIPELA